MIGENNPNSKLSKEDVVEIRQAYAAHKKQKDVYEKYKNKIAWSSF